MGNGNADLIRGLLKKLNKEEGGDEDLVKNPTIIRQCAAGAHGISGGKLRVGQARATLEKQIKIIEGS